MDDALEIVGLNEVPPIRILHKLHLAVEQDHKGDPKKQKRTAKAFEILGRAASKYHIRSPYDVFVSAHALLSKSDDPAFYKNARLLDRPNRHVENTEVQFTDSSSDLYRWLLKV